MLQARSTKAWDFYQIGNEHFPQRVRCVDEEEFRRAREGFCRLDFNLNTTHDI